MAFRARNVFGTFEKRDPGPSFDLFVVVVTGNSTAVLLEREYRKVDPSKSGSQWFSLITGLPYPV